MTRVSRRELFQLASSLVPALCVTRGVFAQTQPVLELHPLADKLTLLTGAGGNIAILQGEDGLLLVDSGLPETAEAVDSKARSVAPKIRVLINTHFHYDHVGGNERLGREGVRIIAHENVLKRVSTPQRNAFFNREWPVLAQEGRPVETFTVGGELTHSGEKVVYKYLPPAHTDGDSIIHFQNANVCHAGDLLFNGFYPFIDYSAGGSIEGMVEASGRIMAAVDAKTKVIPGHGPMATRDDVREFHDMLAGINDAVTKLFKAGKTLQEAQAEEPTKPWDEKWGKGFLKGPEFVHLLYAGKSGGHA
ncbi:MAG TPA: MBL fold metallo-hydrolase [Bryobacteraceae bacterium]|nr:MBL fold metallo-hydrolase [Bryobacteraceae bacterium]